jgi:hypothetical protein
VFYDQAVMEWPVAANCAVLLRDSDRYLEAVALPGGATVRPHERGDRWVSFESDEDDGFCATTWSGYRECFAADGSMNSRTFTK